KSVGLKFGLNDSSSLRGYWSARSTTSRAASCVNWEDDRRRADRWPGLKPRSRTDRMPRIPAVGDAHATTINDPRLQQPTRTWSSPHPCSSWTPLPSTAISYRKLEEGVDYLGGTLRVDHCGEWHLSSVQHRRSSKPQVVPAQLVDRPAAHQ